MVTYPQKKALRKYLRQLFLHIDQIAMARALKQIEGTVLQINLDAKDLSQKINVDPDVVKFAQAIKTPIAFADLGVTVAKMTPSMLGVNSRPRARH